MAKDVWVNAVSNLWNNNADWDLSVTPGATDSAFITAPGNYTVTLTTATSLAAITVNDASAALVDETSGATLTLSGNLTSYGFLGVDNSGSTGGTTWSVGGVLLNAGTMTVGCGANYAALTATAEVDVTGGLVNTGTLNLDGGGAPNEAIVSVGGAAGFGVAGTLTGNVNLSGDALLEFASGSIGEIDAGAELTINGSSAFLANSSDPTGNSALTLLTTVAGSLYLENGAAVTTTTGLVNTGFIGVDNFNSAGGSNFSVGGQLNNAGTITIGSGDGYGALTGPVTVTASGGLVNTGTINLQGGNAPNIATLDIGGVAGFGAAGVLMGNVNLSGDAVIAFGGGTIRTIVAGAELTMNGASTFLADAGAPTSNGALDGLASIAGSLSLENGAAVTVNGDLADSGFLGVDNGSYTGGSSLTVTGQLANSATLTIGSGPGYGALVAPVTVEAGSLANTGTLDLQGGQSPNLATLDISGAAGFGTVGTLTGNVNISGDALLEFGSQSIATIAAGAELTLQGASALLADAGAPTTNSALSGLDDVLGTLSLQNGASVTTSGALDNTGFIGVDNSNSAGGSSLTVGGLWTNAGTLTIGSGSGYGALSAPVTVAAMGGLTNSGTINLQGGGSPNLATLDVSGPAGLGAAGAIEGSVNLSGDALLEFGSDQIETIALGAELTLNGADSLVADAGATTGDSALTGLADVAGTLDLDNGATVVTNGPLIDSGSIALDAPGDTGGSNLTVGDALDVSGSLQIGNTAYGSLIAPATVTAASLVNTGTITLLGNASELAELKVTGAATNAGTLSINATTEMSVGGVFTQQSGSTTVAGDLAASSIDVTGGLLDFTSAVTTTSGVGPITIDPHGEVEFAAAVDSAQSVAFGGALGTLELSDPTDFAGSISGFGGSDVIDLLGVSVASVSYSGDASAGTLTVDETGGGSFALAFTGNYTNLSFAAIADGASGTDIVAAPIDAWSNASGGAWETGANWSTGAPPASTASAVIALAGSYTITLSSAQTVGALTITDASATLAIDAPGLTDTVTGDLIDGGTVSVSTTAASGGSTLDVGGELESTGGVSVQTTNANAGGGSQLSIAGGWYNSATANIDAAEGVGGSDVSVGGSLINSGTINLDTQTYYGLDPSGDSEIAITGQLDNTGTINVGNGILTANSEISAAALTNTGAINLSGNNTVGSGEAAILDIAGAAPTIWTGNAALYGQALLEFGTGHIASIAHGAQIYLSTSDGYIADAGATGANSALSDLVSNYGDLELQYGAAVAISGDLDNIGSLNLDTQTDYGDNFSGGSALTIAGTLTNAGALNLGGGFLFGNYLASTSTVELGQLDNTGTLNLTGNQNTGDTKQAFVDVASAAPTIWTGTVNLSGQALLEYTGGEIADVASGATIYLASTDAYIADAGATTTDSALTGLSRVDGTFNEEYGAAVTTSGDLDVTGSLDLDTTSDYGDAPSGGSSISIGGALINDGTVNIGNGFFGVLQLTSTATIAAASLQNNGTINLSGNNTTTGSTEQAALVISGAAPSQLTGTINLSGEALVEFGSGEISSIAAGAALNLITPDGYVADQGATTSNSALTGLTSNAGTLNLEYGELVSLTGGLSNTGTLDVDTSSPSGWFNSPAGLITGGSSFSADGLVVNSGTMNFGISGIPQPTTIAFGGLQNDASGIINITGGTTNLTTVTVAGSAQAIWTGSLTLAGEATLQFGASALAEIAIGASITIDTGSQGVDLAGEAQSNAALEGLTDNAGSLSLQYGAQVSLTGNLLNTGTVDVDTIGGSGGSALTIAKTLTNQSTFGIGQAGLSAATTVTAGAIDNTATGTLSVSGSTYDVSFDVIGVLTNAGNVNMLAGVNSEVGSLVNTGTISLVGVNQAPSSLDVFGSVDNSYQLTVGAFADMGVGGAFLDSGVLNLSGNLDVAAGIEVSAGGYLDLNAGMIITPASGALTIDSGGVVIGDGTIDLAVVNDYEITASDGSLDISGPITGAGSLAISASAELELGGATAQAVNFGGNAGTLKLDDPTSFTGAIQGLALGDTIDLAGVQATSATVSGSTLTVTTSTGTLDYQVSGAGLTGNTFAIVSDQQGGTDLVLGVPGPAVSGPNAQTVFTNYPAVFGPYTVYDSSAGSGVFTVVVTTTGGLLAAVPAGAGTVSGNITTSLTLTGNLTDLNTELAGMAYLGQATGSDNVTIAVTDPNNLTTTQHVVVTTDSVPYTTPVLNGPSDDTIIPGSMMAIPGLSINDPYSQTIGSPDALEISTSQIDGLQANGSGGTVLGQNTDDLIVIGTPSEINAYGKDDFGSEFLEAAALVPGTIGTAAESAKLIYATYQFVANGDIKSGIDAFKKVLSEGKEEPTTGPLIVPPLSFLDLGVSAASFVLNAAAAYAVTNQPVTQEEWNEFQLKLWKILAGKAAFLLFNDANIVTAGGVTYSFNAAGEFVLTESTQAGNAFQVQVRLQPVSGSSSSSVVTEVAAGLGADKITIAAGRADPVWVDGAPAAGLSTFTPISLADGQLRQLSPNAYQIDWNTGETLTVVDNGSYLDLGVGLASGDAPGTTAGLMGPNNGAGDDFVLPNGTVLTAPLTSAQLYGEFADAWRVTQGSSLFDYAQGQSTATFTNESFPDDYVTLAELEAELPAALVQQAQAAVTAAGITDPGGQQLAEYDYLESGGDEKLVTNDASELNGISTTLTQPTPSEAPATLVGVYAPQAKVEASTTGVTPVTFDVFLTAAEQTATTVDYNVFTPNDDDLNASDFGGSLPSGAVTIAAGQTTGQFTINVPNGALGSNALQYLAVQISSPGGPPVFSPSAQEAVYQVQPGPAAQPVLEYLGKLGNFTRSGSSYTLDLGALQVGEILPQLQFAILNAATGAADSIAVTGTAADDSSFSFDDVAGFIVAGDSLPAALGAGESYNGLNVFVNQDKFGPSDETITFTPVDTNASGYSAPLAPVTLTINYTLELPGMVYSQAWGDVHILTYNQLRYDFQDSGEFTLAKSNVPGDNFQIQMELAPWWSGASVTTIQQVAIALGKDRVTFDWFRDDAVWVDGAPASISESSPTLTFAGGTVTEVSADVYKVDWNTGETMTVSNEFTIAPFISIVDGIPGNYGPGAFSGLQGEDEGTQNDFQLPDGTVLPQPLTTAELYGPFADAWQVSPATSLFDGPAPINSGPPADPLTLADIPASVVAQAAQLVAAAGIVDPGIAQAAELDYIATGDPAFIQAAANIQQLGIVDTTSPTINPSSPPAPSIGVQADAVKVVAAASGTTAVTFTAYLTSGESTPTTIDYAVTDGGIGYFDASAFGGTFPSGSVTLAAEQTSAQFTIDVPQGALGTTPDENLQVTVSSPDGAAQVFAKSAQTEVVNSQMEPGNLAVAALGYLGNVGQFSFDAATNTYTLDLGDVTEDSSIVPVAFAVMNNATAPSDNLTGTFTPPAGKGFVVTGDNVPAPLGPGQNYQGLDATVDTALLGANDMSLVFSPTDVNDSGYSAALTPLTLDITDTVVAPALQRINTPTTIIFPNAHVGALESQHVSVTNAAAAGAQNLDVTLAPSEGATASGAISALAPGATNASALSVGIVTSAGGAISGSVAETFASDGGSSDISPIATDGADIDVFGAVYRLASAAVQPTDLTVRVGDSGNQTITISNTDPNDGYSENLIASVVGTTGAVTAHGATGDIAAQSSGTLNVDFSTATPGQIGTVTLDLKSDGAGIDGLGMTDLGDVTIPIAVTSGNRPAAAQFEEISGGGTWTQSGAAYTLALGSIDAPTTIALGILNSATAPADPLSGSFSLSGSDEFLNSGFAAFSGVAAGSADTAPSVTLGGGSAGTFSEMITLSPVDASGGGNVALAPETLTITGTVTEIAPVLTAPATAAITQNLASSIGTVSVSDADPYAPSETFTVTLLALQGDLSAATSGAGGGGTITGAGTPLLEIVGSLTQINADLSTLTDTDASTADDTIAISVQDGRGGADRATVDVTVAQQAPTVTIDAVDGDNVINNAEANAAGGVPLSGTVTGLAAAATFSVSVVDGGFSKTYTATVNSAATGWTATIPESDAITLPDGTAALSAQVTNGSLSATATENVTVAETLPTVTIAAVDGDNVINNAEANASAGVPLTGTVTGLAAAATFSLSVVDGAFSGSYTATVDAAGSGWTATIPEADAITLPNGTATLSAQVTDANGNVSAVATDNVTVAETLPSVTIAAVDGNNVIDYADAQVASGVPLTGTVTGLASGATFAVSLVDGSFSADYTATIDAAGTGWTATIPEDDALALPIGTATLSTAVTDAYGNVSATATDVVDVAGNNPTVTIAAVDGDNVINHAQAYASTGVALGGTVSGIAAGATFAVSVVDGSFSGSYTATVDAAATGWTADIPEDDAITLPDGTATLSAQVTDSHGNVSAIATDDVTVAETAPTVTIAAVDGDNVINSAEANGSGGVPLSGTVTGLAAGATFALSVADGSFSSSFTATVDAAATGWTAAIPEADAISLPDGTATLSASVTDAHGNVSATATDNVTVAETPPTVTIAAVDGNNVIDYAEAKVPSGVPLTGTVTGLAAGATFAVSVVDGSFSASYAATVDAAGTGWTATIPQDDAIALPIGTATLSAQVTDAYGNVSATATDIVTVAGNYPTVTISPVDGDNVINHAEAYASNGVALGGTVSGIAAGATFAVSVVDGAFSESYTATVDAAATGWTADIPEADAIKLPDGAATLSARVTDADDHVSNEATDTVTVAETLPTLTFAAVDGDNVINYADARARGGVTLSGTVSGLAAGAISADASPGALFGGTVAGLAAGATFAVSVVDGSFSKTYTATVDATGTGWTAMIPEADATALPDGTATLSAQVTDAHGNVSAPATDAVTVAETLPIVTIGEVDGDNAINYADASASAGVPLSGTVSGIAAGSTFAVSVVDGSFSGSYTATVDAAGTGWTAAIPEAAAITLPYGTATVSAQVTDVHGNASSTATDDVAVNLTVATILPKVTIASVEGDNVINYADAHASAGVPLSGTVTGIAAGSTFAVSIVDGAFSASYTATVDAAGTGWTATIPEGDAIALPNGAATLSAQVTDALGNVSAKATDTVTVNEALPPAPVIQSPANGATISDKDPAITGTSQAGDTVTVTIDGAKAGTTTVASDGNWTFTPPTALDDGGHVVTATAVNGVGSTSESSAAVDFTIETVAPAAPVIDDPANGTTIAENDPAISGTGDAGDTLAVTIDGLLAGTTTVLSGGTWSFTPTTALADGGHDVTATQTNAAGTVSAASAEDAFTVDTATPPAPIIQSPTSGSTVTTAEPEISGTGEAGDTVTVSINGAKAGTANVDSSGDWTYTPTTALADGSQDVTATQTNAASTVSAMSNDDRFTVNLNGSSYGDVHMITYDGLRYDFQAVGTYILTRATAPGDDFEIQIVTAADPSRGAVSIMTNVAARVGADVVTFGLDRDSVVWIDGVADTTLSGAGATQALAGGKLMELSPDQFQIDWNSGETLLVTDQLTCLDTQVMLGAANGPGSQRGLLGSDSGQAQDFQLPDGQVLTQPIDASEILGLFANAWSVTSTDTLFGDTASSAPNSAVATPLAYAEGGGGARVSRAEAPGQILLANSASEVLSDTGGLGATFEGSLAALSRELIAGFSTRDLIDVTNINSASATFAYAGSGGMGVLTLRDGGQTGELYLDGNLAGGTFHLASDGRGGTLISFH